MLIHSDLGDIYIYSGPSKSHGVHPLLSITEVQLLLSLHFSRENGCSLKETLKFWFTFISQLLLALQNCIKYIPPMQTVYYLQYMRCPLMLKKYIPQTQWSRFNVQNSIKHVILGLSCLVFCVLSTNKNDVSTSPIFVRLIICYDCDFI